MDLSKVISISGKPGLYLIKSQAKGRVIVESLLDGKSTPAFSNERMSSLEEISIFTTDQDKPLKEVFCNIHEKMGDTVDFDYKKADAALLRAKFAEVLPEYDHDSVYPSDMKKVFAWYQLLINNNLLDFTPESDETQEETPTEE